ncbi:MAG: DMT family transporter [Calditrichia bacterium]
MNFVRKYFAVIFLSIPFTWAGSFIAGKYVIHDIDPIASVFLRFFLSSLVMFPALLYFHRKSHPDFRNRRFLFHLFLVVLTAGIGYHIFFFWALEYTSPTNTALIIALNPFFTAFGEIIFFKKVRPRNFYLGFLLAFGGAVWVNISRGGHIDFSAVGKGELLCLAASLLWSVYTITAKLTKEEEWDSLWINAYNYLFTALLILPFTWKIFLPSFLSIISGRAWLGLWYMAIFPTAIGYTLFYIGVQKKGPAWAATFIYLVPSITAGLDHFFFRARLSFPMITGTLLVVIGLMVGNMKWKALAVASARFGYLLGRNANRS